MHFGIKIKSSAKVLFFKQNDGQACAEIGGIEIADNHRGQHLSDYLYNFNKEYLRNEKFTGPIYLFIREDNIASLKSAERNRFSLDKIDGDCRIFIYEF